MKKIIDTWNNLLWKFYFILFGFSKNNKEINKEKLIKKNSKMAIKKQTEIKKYVSKINKKSK